MSIQYNIECDGFKLPSSRKALTKWLKAAAEAEGYQIDEVTYIFRDSQSMLEMNRTFLHHDYFTDIITFDYADMAEKGHIAGDIFIDTQTVADNAAQFGVTAQCEMRRVMVHGVLHLCGQGDKSPSAAREMRRKENRYIKLFSQQIITK